MHLSESEYISSDESFSFSEAEMSKMQDAILKESKQIEEYLSQQQKTDDISSMKALKTLFELFKSELTINISLRHTLLQQKKANNQLPELYRKLENIGITDINDIESLYYHIKNQNKTNVDLKNMNYQLKNYIKKMKKINLQENQKLSNEINEIQKKISLSEKNRNEIFQENISIKETIKEKENKIDELTQENQSLKLSINMKDEKNKKSLKELKKQLLQSENSRNQMAEEISAIKKEFEEYKTKSANIINFQANNDSLLNDKKDNETNEKTIFINQLTEKIHFLENKEEELNKTISNYKVKTKKILKQMIGLQTQIDEITQEHQNQISIIQKEHKKKREKMRKNINDFYQAKLRENEFTEKQQLETIRQQNFEITNIRDINRQLLYNLEKQETQNAKLETELQLLRCNIYEPNTKKKSKKKDD